MTLIFTDGFDHYTTILQKWSAGTSTISSGAARTGGGGLTQTGVPTTKQVSAADEHATFIWAMPIERGSPNGTFEWRFLSDSLATTHITVQATATGEIKVFRGTIAGTQIGSTVTAGTIPAGTYTHVTVLVTLHDSTGVVTIWVNGTQVFTATGADTKNAGTKTVLDGIGMVITNAAAKVDDVVLMNGAGSVNNDNIGDVKIETLFPNGNGASSQLVGSDGNSTDNYLLVDEAAPSTVDYVGSATNDNFDIYTLTDLATAVGVVYATNTWGYTFKSDAGTKGGALMVQSGGTDYEQADVALSTSPSYQNAINEVDPNTTAAWTISGVNASGVGFKVKAS